MQDLQDALSTLGFVSHANPTYADLKKRWKDLCQLHHPDKPGGTNEAFRKVTHAYKLLTDAEYRQTERDRAAQRGNVNARGGLDIRMMIPVSFEDAFFGRKLQISYSICQLDENLQMIPIKDGGELELDRIAIELTPNTMDGHQQLLPGRGHRCGEERGNVLIAVQVLPHPRFHVRDGHVHSTENLPLDLCLKGGQVDVLTMYGLRTVRVRPGTKPGDTIRVPGCGPVREIAFSMRQQKGDQLVTVNVNYPSADDLKANKTWQRLDIEWDEEVKPDGAAEALLWKYEQMRKGEGGMG